MDRIYLSPPDIGVPEREAVLDALDSGWVAPAGPHIDAFEREVAERVGAAHAVALSSGTAALHLALLLAGVGENETVLVPTFTFVASANAVRYLGARPVFIDCDPDTWQVDPGLVADAVASRDVRAVVTVDLFGACADHDPIVAACSEKGVSVVEDAAEALGATYRGRSAGTLGNIGVFSFNGNKIITTSGGGMLVCDDPELAGRARHLAAQARDPAPHYEHSQIGFNYRMSNLLAAIGRAQLAGLDSRLEARSRIREQYAAAFADVDGIALMPETGYGRPNRWLTCVTVDPRSFGATRDDVIAHLQTLNIEARPVWKPLHLQPVYREAERIGGAAAEDIFARGLCLPSGSTLSDADQERVVGGILRAGHKRPDRTR